MISNIRYDHSVPDLRYGLRVLPLLAQLDGLLLEVVDALGLVEGLPILLCLLLQYRQSRLLTDDFALKDLQSLLRPIQQSLGVAGLLDPETRQRGGLSVEVGD